MSKVENNSQVVKKEIIKLKISDLLFFVELGDENKSNKITKDANLVLKTLSRSCMCATNSSLSGFDIKREANISFICLKEIIFIFCTEEISLEKIRLAAQELEEKGYLFRDKDGCLAFAPTGSVQ